jgi:hypothetical protein
LWEDYSRLSETERAAAAESVLGRFGDWLRAFRRHSPAALIVHSLETPMTPNQGILDGQSEDNQAETIRQINRGLRTLAREHRGVYILD